MEQIDVLPTRGEVDVGSSRFRNKRVNPCTALAVAVVLIALPLTIGMIDYACMGRPRDIDWYQRINKPRWTPPGWAIGAIWGALYVLMGFASFLIWYYHVKRGIPIVAAALAYGVNLILHGIWTPIFFTLGWFLVALIDGGLLFLTVIACIILFWRVHIAPAILMMPYAAWLVISFYLNLYVVMNNPEGKNQNLPVTETANTTTTAAP